MLDLHNDQNNKKDYEVKFNKDCSHLMEEVERQIQISISTFNNIFDDNTNLNTNPTNNGAISLVEKAKNSAVRMKQFRNVDFPKIIYDLNKAANKFEEAQLTAKEQPTGWILKRKIRRFEEENNGMLDQILFNTEIINKSAQEVYTRLTRPQIGFQFKPLECNKPQKLTLSSMKSEWETLSGWIRKRKEYISSGHTYPEACNHTATIRTIIKGFLDDHIKQRCESSLDATTTVE